jgi:hypothetical protein
MPLLAQFEEWLQAAQVAQVAQPPLYEELVRGHNAPLSEKFGASPLAYYEHLREQVELARTLLDELS